MFEYLKNLNENDCTKTALKKNDISLSVLVTLKKEDLVEIGIDSFGQRRLLLDFIKDSIPISDKSSTSEISEKSTSESCESSTKEKSTSENSENSTQKFKNY
jgi:hypothetical protein